MVYELKKKSEQLIIFHVPHCLISELFYNKEKRVLQASLMQLINLYFNSHRNKSLLRTALFSFSWKLMTVCAVGFYQLLLCQEVLSAGT